MGQSIRSATGLVGFAMSLLQSTKSQCSSVVRPAEPDAGKAHGRGPRSCRQSRMQDKELQLPGVQISVFSDLLPDSQQGTGVKY